VLNTGIEFLDTMLEIAVSLVVLWAAVATIAFLIAWIGGGEW